MTPWLSPAPPVDVRTGHSYKVQDKSSKTLHAGGAAGAGGDGSLGSLAARGRAARHREERHACSAPPRPPAPGRRSPFKSSGGRASLGTPAPGPLWPARPPGLRTPLTRGPRARCRSRPVTLPGHSPGSTRVRARPGPMSASLLRPGRCPPPTHPAAAARVRGPPFPRTQEPRTGGTIG